MNEIELIDGLIEETNNLKYDEHSTLDKIKRKIQLYDSKLIGGNKYSTDVSKIRFGPMAYPTTEDIKKRCWNDGINQLLNLLFTFKEEIELFGTKTQFKSDIKEENNLEKSIFNNRVFIVHGHDDSMKNSVARIIDKLELEPIILHEQANKNRTIIEKLEEEGKNCIFAIILLSSDDKGYCKSNPSQIKERARQNVILELGYFMGKLGRDKVIALYSPSSDFEMPSDFDGTLYVKYDKEGAWKFQLAKELKASGIEVDLNKII